MDHEAVKKELLALDRSQTSPTSGYSLKNDRSLYSRMNDNERDLFNDFQKRINESMVK